MLRVYWPHWIAALVATAFLTAGSPAQAQKLHEQIDLLVAAQTPNYATIAAPIADDAEFLRRVTLDLTGTIPTVEAARAFLADTTADKRTKLIDTLLASPEYARHMQRTFDLWMMRRLPGKHVPEADWQKFLRESFAANKPYDEIVRTLFTVDGSDPASRGAARYLLDRDADLTTVTRDVSKMFLGANLECAQCHDHPNVDDYKQRDYYGVAAFFNRTFVFTEKDKPPVLAEKGDGDVTFESVFEVRDKVSTGPKSTGPRVFSASVITDPAFSKPEEAYLVAPADNVRPVPKFSRRAKFAEFVISAENRRFCRTTANRVWSMLLGRGLVHPVDYDHPANPPSHPAVLALLTDHLAENGLDLKNLIRDIVLSQTYQRGSRTATTDPSQLPAEKTFAVAILKPLTPAQMAWSTLEATGQTGNHRTALGTTLTEAALHDQLVNYETWFTDTFGGVRGKPPEQFESTTEQVLFLANNGAVMGLVVPAGTNLSARIHALPADNPKAIADELYLSAMTRYPTDEEVQDAAAYLNGLSGEDRTKAIAELIWAAVASAEFRFNH